MDSGRSLRSLKKRQIFPHEFIDRYVQSVRQLRQFVHCYVHLAGFDLGDHTLVGISDQFGELLLAHSFSLAK